jgi:hypothetical protein
LSNALHILNGHRKTLGAKMMSLEQEKMHQTGNRYEGFMLLCSWSILNAHRADLNTQRASSKRLQNKNDNLNDIIA